MFAYYLPSLYPRETFYNICIIFFFETKIPMLNVAAASGRCFALYLSLASLDIFIFYSLHFTFNTSTSQHAQPQGEGEMNTKHFILFSTEPFLHLYRVHNIIYDTLCVSFWQFCASQFNVFFYTWLCTLLLLGFDCIVVGF